jgi:predicted RNase H-like HicB family nuclease
VQIGKIPSVKPNLKSELKTLNLQKMYVMKTYQFTAEITRDNEINQYIGVVPGLQGAHTQASTLDELQTNLKEVIQLCLGEMTDEEINNIPDFVGFQQISVAV